MSVNQSLIGLQSPWGEVDCARPLIEGASSVGTAGHGGIMIPTNVAKKHLSSAALKRAIVFGDWCCFEEDSAWAIACFEWLTLARVFLGTLEPYKYLSDPELLENLKEHVEHSNADYLMERGIQVSDAAAEKHKNQISEHDLRNERSPRLIVSAIGAGAIVVLHTADGSKHVAKSDEYSAMREAAQPTRAPLLLENLPSALPVNDEAIRWLNS